MRLFPLCGLVALASFAVVAQTRSLTPAKRDPQALTILLQASQALSTNGMLVPIRAYSATGTATIWAGQDTSAPVTLRGVGLDAIRLEVSSPDGQFVWAITSNQSAYNTHGNQSVVSPHMRFQRSDYFLIPFLLSAVTEETTSIEYLGQQTESGGSVEKVRIGRRLPLRLDSDGTLSRALVKDLYFDSSNHRLMRVEDKAYSANNFNDSFSHVVTFSDFRDESGWQIPHVVEEKIAGTLVSRFVFDAFEPNAPIEEKSLDLDNP